MPCFVFIYYDGDQGETGQKKFTHPRLVKADTDPEYINTRIAEKFTKIVREGSKGRFLMIIITFYALRFMPAPGICLF